MADKVTCPMCGFQNMAGTSRCVSCGAKIEALGSAEYTPEEELARRYEQESFEWKWVGAAFGICLALQAVVLIALPLAIDRYDPQGLPGLGISIVIWFLAGMVTGVVSPGRTFLEPATGAALACPPTIFCLLWITAKGFEPPLYVLVVGGVIGVLVALVGAFFGEKIQLSR